jgi:hypothetical protein
MLVNETLVYGYEPFGTRPGNHSGTIRTFVVSFPLVIADSR